MVAPGQWRVPGQGGRRADQTREWNLWFCPNWQAERSASEQSRGPSQGETLNDVSVWGVLYMRSLKRLAQCQVATTRIVWKRLNNLTWHRLDFDAAHCDVNNAYSRFICDFVYLFINNSTIQGTNRCRLVPETPICVYLWIKAWILGSSGSVYSKRGKSVTFGVFPAWSMYSRGRQRGARGHQVARKDHVGRPRPVLKITSAWSISSH